MNMCTRVQSSSAFRTTKATTSTPDQKSLAIRKKNVLTRDDSGVFSASPSPLTPSHSAVFPPPPLTATSPSSTAIGAMSKATQGASNSRDEDPSPLGLGRPTFPPTAEQHRGHPIADNGYHGVQKPAQTDDLYRAFTCRASTSPERWTSCNHTHCTNIRNQWQHLTSCLTSPGQPCKECQSFQRVVLIHAAHCLTEDCIVTLCSDAKQQIGFINAPQTQNGRSRPPKLGQFGRSNSVQDTNKEHVLPLLHDGGSLDDMATSPMSPLSLQELNKIGAGALPWHLRSSYSQRAAEIVSQLESEGPLDEFCPPVETSTPQSAPLPPTQQASSSRSGILSPIEEHPSSDSEEVMSCDYPSQIILHPLQSDFLTQGRDGRYLHRRDYDLNEHLGVGGFGTCACARDYKTDKIFVVKSNKSNDDTMINSLKAESDILARIPQHNNITTFLGAVIEEEVSEDGPLRNCRLMMELAEHGSLASMLRDEEGGADGLHLDQSLFYLHQILQGVFHLHTHSIVHLDIKAENILVLEGGRRVKLADFGTACHIDEIAGCVSKLNIGFTPHFSAPEIIRGDIPSFSSDIWSTVCVLIQLITARLPGYCTGTVTRESMMYMLGNYKDSEIEKLIPLTYMGVPKEVCDLFHDTLRSDPSLRPSALKLLSYDALKDACEYEQYFDVDCSQFSEQEEDLQSGVEPSFEGTEPSSLGHTLPTSLPHLIMGPGDEDDSDVSLDRPIRSKKMSQDSGVSRGYERMQSEVFPIDPTNDDSGIDTPGQDYPATQRVHLATEGVITEDREGEERFTSVGDRVYSQPEAPVNYKSISMQYRQRSMSATYQRTSTTGLKFGQVYADTNETFLSLPSRPTSGFANQVQKMRPKFLIHSNSAPVVGSDGSENGTRGCPASGLGGNQNGVAKRLRRSSSEVYVDRGPDIDTPEEKKKKRELALAAAAKLAEEEQMVAMTENLRIDQSSSRVGSHSPPSQRSDASSASGNQSDRRRSGGNYPSSYSRQGSQQTARGHTHYGGHTQETLV